MNLSPSTKQIFCKSIVFPTIQLPRETRSSTRRETNSCTNRETRCFTRRQLLARERRSRRAQIVRENQAARNIAHSDVNLVQQHFNRMRNRPLRLPSNNGISDEDSNSDKTPHGIQELTLPLLFSLQLLTCITIQTCIMNSTTFALTARCFFPFNSFHVYLSKLASLPQLRLPSLQFNVVER